MIGTSLHSGERFCPLSRCRAASHAALVCRLFRVSAAPEVELPSVGASTGTSFGDALDRTSGQGLAVPLTLMLRFVFPPSSLLPFWFGFLQNGVSFCILLSESGSLDS